MLSIGLDIAFVFLFFFFLDSASEPASVLIISQFGSEDITRKATKAMLKRPPTDEKFRTTAAFLALQLLYHYHYHYHEYYYHYY